MGQAADGEEAVRIVEELKPDVIVMDVIMPGKDGIDACREIMELLPDTRVMMLTASTEEDAVIEAIAAGATGYLQKYSRPEELVVAVLDVAEGRLRIPEQAVRRVFAMIRGQRELISRQPLDRLTTLERETLTLFASGRSYAEISADRGNSVVTVRKPSTAYKTSWGCGRSRNSSSGRCGTACWMTSWWALTPCQHRSSEEAPRSEAFDTGLRPAQAPFAHAVSATLAHTYSQWRA